MSEPFTADWLTLREPYDAMAVDHDLLKGFAAWAVATQPAGGLRVIDLGAGTGANLRRLAPLLGHGQRWTLVELDPALIAAGEASLPSADGVDARYRRLDLARDLERLADDGPADLLTASALLDLVSEDWLRRLVSLCSRLGCALYASLTYDGRVAWSPEDALDAESRAAVDHHQRTDKGFGPALGPEATLTLARLLDGAVRTAASDWRLGPDDAEIQRELLRGYALAAEAV
ncbi:MAG TPA: class I SAM-dependent methyltransferase, partial [Geminicoccaceae bacterium]